MRSTQFALLLVVFGLAEGLSGCTSAPPPAGLLGAYRLDDDRVVSIRRSVDDTLRFRVFDDGSSGRLYPAGDYRFVSGPGFSDREPVALTIDFALEVPGVARRITWTEPSQPPTSGTRIGTERNLWIDSNGTPLFARLHLPDAEPPFAAVVLVHGSGDDAGTEWLYNGDFFVAHGFAVLNYDKRGTGQSGGEFTFNFDQLAGDASAALALLASQPEIDAGCIGLSGYSQGAWVAPLAASRSPLGKFVLASYGMITSPAEEARLEMRQLLVDANVPEADIAQADELIRAAVEVVAGALESGWEHFDSLKSKYRHASWLAHLDGTPVGQLVSYPRWLVKLIGKRQLPRGLPWHYDSRELLRKTAIPAAWLLAAEDRSAPNEETIAILDALIQQGKPYNLEVFPATDHGMVTFTRHGTELTYTGYSPDYFRAEVEALRRLSCP